MKFKGKKIFVFADILELGTNSSFKHALISDKVNQSNIDVFLTYGKFSKTTSNRINNPNIFIKHFTRLSKN